MSNKTRLTTAEEWEIEFTSLKDNHCQVLEKNMRDTAAFIARLEGANRNPATASTTKSSPKVPLAVVNSECPMTQSTTFQRK